MLVIGDIVRLNARKYPQKAAIIMGEKYLSYSQLNNLANQLANALLKVGIKPGDKIALMSDNSLEFLIVNYAVAKCGALLVPINYRFKKDEVVYIIQNCQANAFFFSDEFIPLVEEASSDLNPMVKLISISGHPLDKGLSMKKMMEGISTSEPGVIVDPVSPASIMYTSGTTGIPKGVLMSHASLLAVNTGAIIEGDLRSSDTALVAMPLFHNGGLNILLQPTLQIGGTAVILPRGFDPEIFMDAITKFNVSLTLLVPTQISILTNFPKIREIPSLKKLWYGASAISPEVLNRALEMFATIKFYQWFGLSETGLVARLRPEDHEKNAYFTGKEMFNAEIRIVDEEGNNTPLGEVGEIISSQRYHGMLGYHNMPEETKRTIRNGWIYTEDLARVEGDGFFSIVDRRRDMIISGGENIYSKEVEDTIIRHTGVKEVAVFGIPDPTWGEAVYAAIVKRVGYKFGENDIIDFCASKIASYKKPQKVLFVDDLPKNAAGKIMKNELREKFGSGKVEHV
jgi:fatty-acyl-CoA synthase